MMMTVKMMMLNWVHDTSARAEVLFSEELTEKIVCRVVGANVLFITGVDTDVVKEALETKMVEPSGVGTITSENKKKQRMKCKRQNYLVLRNNKINTHESGS